MKYLHLKEQKIPLYRGKLVMILTNSKKKLRKHVPEYKGETLYAHAIYTDWNGVQGFAIVLNFNNKFRKIHHGTIAHEVIHITNFISDMRDIRLDLVNDEPIAYLAEWITDQIYAFVRKHKFKI